MSEIVVCAMYKFVRLPDYECLREPLLRTLLEQEVRGTLLLAAEGINGTIAGTRRGIDAVLEWFARDVRFDGISIKESFDTSPPFYRTKVKLKREIVTMGVEGIDPRHVVGTYVKPTDWNRLISDPDVLLVDTRNDYEVQIGKFHNAVNPGTETFREFPDYVRENLDPARHKKVAMYCTGGIRCEKSTALLKTLGFSEVYHLEGGILQYLEDVPPGESLWEGECFVFDNRVSVNHHLEKGSYDQCHGCRMPITASDMASPDYVKGVSCPHCAGKTSERQVQRFESRERQMELAKARGEAHIGAEAVEVLKLRQSRKRQLRKHSDA
jgi:UPF0176 protein